MVKEETKKLKKDEYIEAIGRRKTARARVRIWQSKKPSFFVNDKDIKDYFPLPSYVQKAIAPLQEMDLFSKFKVSILARGGGLSAQSEAICHGLGRALIKFDPELREKIKKLGFLTRDSRMKERKKPGLKRARKAPQWQKR